VQLLSADQADARTFSRGETSRAPENSTSTPPRSNNNRSDASSRAISTSRGGTDCINRSPKPPRHRS
jgi:hypothetical protein